MRKEQRGFTLVEVLITLSVMALVLVSLLNSFVYFSVLSNASGNLSLAVLKVQSKSEEIRAHNFDLITTDYSVGGTPGPVILLTRANDGVDGSLIVYLDQLYPDLLQVNIVASWRNKEGRIIGGDNGGSDPAKALNGVVDPGEPVDVNGRLLSPELTGVTYVAKR